MSEVNNNSKKAENLYETEEEYEMEYETEEEIKKEIKEEIKVDKENEHSKNLNNEYVAINNNHISKSEEIIEGEEDDTMNSFQKLINIVVSPSKALKAIKIKPNILIPMIVVILVPLLYSLLFWGNLETQMIQQMEAQFEAQGLEMTEDMISVPLKFARIFAPIGVVLGILFSGFFSTLYYFICSKIAKSEVTFKKITSMIFHIMVISIFSTILLVLLSLLGVESGRTVAITSMASFLPASMQTSPIYGFIMPIEVFGIWSSCITYFGLRIVADLSKKAALISVILAFVAGMLIAGGSIWFANLMNSLSTMG